MSKSGPCREPPWRPLSAFVPANPTSRLAGPVLLVACLLLVTVAVSPTLAGGAQPHSPLESTDGDSTDTARDPAGHTAQQPEGERGLGSFAQADIESDTVALVTSLDSDGDATWEVVYRLELATDEERQAFAEQRADIQNDTDAYLDPFTERMERTVATARNATNRSMSATDFAVSTDRVSQPQADFGVVTFEFRWTGFAQAEGDSIRAGDAIDQFFLNEDERLEVNWPDGYSHTSSSPAPGTVDDSRVVWRGPLTFDEGQPRLVVSSEDSRSLPVLLGLLGVGVLVAAAVFVVFRRRRGDDSEGTVAPGPSATSEDPAGPDSLEDTARGGAASAGGVADDAYATGGTEGDDSTPASPPSELLRNEERLLQLLEQHGGRMKQKAVAEQLDWSAAKTSQVVGTLRENDAVESFRIGRENVLALPETGIADFEDGPQDTENGGGPDADGDDGDNASADET